MIMDQLLAPKPYQITIKLERLVLINLQSVITLQVWMHKEIRYSPPSFLNHFNCKTVFASVMSLSSSLYLATVKEFVFDKLKSFTKHSAHWYIFCFGMATQIISTEHHMYHYAANHNQQMVRNKHNAPEKKFKHLNILTSPSSGEYTPSKANIFGAMAAFLCAMLVAYPLAAGSYTVTCLFRVSIFRNEAAWSPWWLVDTILKMTLTWKINIQCE